MAKMILTYQCEAIFVGFKLNDCTPQTLSWNIFSSFDILSLLVASNRFFVSIFKSKLKLYYLYGCKYQYVLPSVSTQMWHYREAQLLLAG